MPQRRSPGSPQRKVPWFGPSGSGFVAQVREVVPAPRGKDMGELSALESPRTPKATTTHHNVSPPAFAPKLRNPQPPLLRALLTKSIDEVKEALQQNPEEANEPFWDHDWEPPLCCAVRLECSASIVKLLLEYGADPQSKDVRGRDPSMMFKESQTGEDKAITGFAPMC